MRIPFLATLVALTLAEIAVFIFVGEALGVLVTLALTLLGMVAGAALLRRQGVATLMRIRAETAAGRLPAQPLVEGAVLAAAALLIIVPGFVTDLIGLLLFIPLVREALWRTLLRRIEFGRASAEALSPAEAAVVELDRSEYASNPQPDSPWRRSSEHQA